MNPIKPKQDVVPLSTFRANVSELLKQAQQTGRPIVITQHGRGAAVLISADEYEALLDKIEMLASVGRGLAQSATGRTHSHEEVMASARKIIADAKRAQAKRKKKSKAAA